MHLLGTLSIFHVIVGSIALIKLPSYNLCPLLSNLYLIFPHFLFILDVFLKPSQFLPPARQSHVICIRFLLQQHFIQQYSGTDFCFYCHILSHLKLVA